MLIATKNKPKGPNTKQLNQYVIDLSGSKLTFTMPNGNSTDVPNPQGAVLKKINIYENLVGNDENSNCTVLAERWFDYKGFLGENLGSIHFLLRLYHSGSQNLFNQNDFGSYLNQYHSDYCKKWNSDADESCQISSPDSYTDFSSNNIDYLHYKIAEQQSSIMQSLYSVPVSSNHYIEVMFRYIGIIDMNAPWLKLANNLENNILSSIDLKLVASAQADKASAVLGMTTKTLSFRQ